MRQNESLAKKLLRKKTEKEKKHLKNNFKIIKTFLYLTSNHWNDDKSLLFKLLNCFSTILNLFFSFSASNIRYKITSGNIGNVFGVHNSTGAIYIAGELDYEKLKKVILCCYLFYDFFQIYTKIRLN
jgi:hypothetical protein